MRKRLWAAVWAVALVCLCTCAQAQTFAEIFPDENMARTVAGSLQGTDNIDIQAEAADADLAEVNSLNVKDAASWEGIQKLTNLTYLHVYNSDNSDVPFEGDLNDISACTKLTSLNISVPVSGDLSALSGMTKMEDLSLDNISRLSGKLSDLSRMTSLKRLTLWGSRNSQEQNVTGELSDLAGMKDLDMLMLVSVDISGEISALASLDNLTVISMGNVNVTGDLKDLTSMEQMNNLHLYDLNEDFVFTFDEDLKKMTGLTALDVGGIFVGDLTVMDDMPALAVIRLYGTYQLDKIVFEDDDPIVVNAPEVTQGVYAVPGGKGGTTITWYPPLVAADTLKGTLTDTFTIEGSKLGDKYKTPGYELNLGIAQPYEMPRVLKSRGGDWGTPGNGCFTGLKSGRKYYIIDMDQNPEEKHIVNADGTVGGIYTAEEAFDDLPALTGTVISGLQNYRTYRVRTILAPSEEDEPYDTVEGDVVGKVEDLPEEPVQAPTIILGDLAKTIEEQVELVVEPIETQRENTVAFEIELVYEESGEAVDVKQSVQLCLPFPMDMTYEDCMSLFFSIRHDMSTGTQWFYTSDGSIRLTQQGLMITVDSFSPFTMTWDEAETGGWGDLQYHASVPNYVDADGITSALMQENSMAWVRETAGGVNTWFGIDNTGKEFPDGSRFWVHCLDSKENAVQWNAYADMLDDGIKDEIEDGKICYFEMGVASVDGHDYTQLNRAVNIMTQIPDGWDIQDVKAVHISEVTDERIMVSAADQMESPEGKKAFSVLEVEHFSLYAIYDALSDEERAELKKADDLPQTGDNDHLFVWYVLLIMCAAGCAALKRRAE